MKIITQIFALFVALIVFPIAMFGQAKSIAGEQYYSALRESELKTGKQTKKRVQIQKLYTDGKITGTITGTTEYFSPDNSRWTYVENINNVVKKIEQITIGITVYRKTDNGAWVKSKMEDRDGIGGIGGRDNSKREFFIEEEKLGEEVYQVLTEKRVNFNNTYFDTNKVTISKQGLIQRETKITSKNDSKDIVSSVEITYDYTSKIAKIKAPIK